MGIEYETIENLFVFNQKDVIDIKLLFWNLKRNSIEKYIIDIIIENNIDVCIFAEYSGIKFDNVLLELKNNYGLFDVKLAVEITESLKYVAAYMDVILNTGGLEVLDAGGVTGNNEYCAVTYCLECGGTVLGVLVVA